LFGASRIDRAVVNGSVHGYEIKSETDDLTRLPAQARAYCSPPANFSAPPLFTVTDKHVDYMTI